MMDMQRHIHQLQAENKVLREQLGADEALFEVVRDKIPALPLYQRQPIPKTNARHAENVAVAIITDTHSDEYVCGEEMEGLAKHDWDTHQARMETMANKTAEITRIVRATSNVKRLVVWLLGDFFLGQIHAEESAYGESMTLPQALPAEGRVLADTLMRMAASFDEVRVVGMCGNHGRTSRKPVFKATADRNWDMAVYLIAKEISRHQTNMEWVLPKSVMYVDLVLGWRNLVTHGNCVNITHRTPYFGIEDSFIRQRDSRRKTDQDFDFAWMGHLHHEFSLRGYIRGVPSMIGANQFSQYKMHCASAAQQQLVFFTEKHGPTSNWLINL